ncbi:exopolysaccharide biosynthesis polyprenyl glycosylphosphotransferase [Streptomyces neyagawaensis]|uniref:exopolysaccharide biosynthesis polyprenyl glycosylphosphotransferase n=1 Tax=Streptomyces neyagawaensis TaxID=42238 RepID=UPI0006E2F870|nr:exopolysaccharide biosynthesis polyprenyl glycosylphosphotransferase [Streptomyces neyagawaensis]MCL6733256.1 exopolysaccharide biosynthesis polyprenyl glycosylphosphotransferase [Streptomyces neyagawaensis]MDE1685058.1 exopolysaccharide biosynthesis polyprenyl glycosylphosphotransferase [Streptomyces neyagawaensis]
MTADSTISSTATHPHEHRTPPVSVMPTRGAVPSAPRPAGRPRPPGSAPPVSLLVADGTAALLGVLTLTGPQLHPLALALLAAFVLLRPHRTRPPLPGVLDELPANCGRTAVAWLALAALTAAYRPEHALSARALLLGFAVQAAASCALRGIVHTWCRSALLRNPGAALVIGPAATAQRVAAAVLRHPRCGLRPVGVVAEQQDGAGGLPVLTTGEEVARAVVQNGVRAALVVAPSVRSQQGPLLSALAEWGCTVWEVDADSPSYATKEQLAGFSCRLLQRSATPLASAGKRAFDVLVSATLLLLVSPLLLVCAVALRISDGPGVVFRQERIGKDGKPFTLLKFRTHRPLDEHEAATRWSVANEHEMRGFCRMLRRTSLDELLQLWNVLRGDMSLVGPRPERPYFVGQFSESYPGYAARHRMRTGITGLAQVHGLRGDTSIEDRFRFDNVYIDNWSLWQDVCILLRTVGTLTRPTGS